MYLLFLLLALQQQSSSQNFLTEGTIGTGTTSTGSTSTGSTSTVSTCKVANGLQSVSPIGIDSSFRYNWYYGTIGGSNPGVVLIKTSSLDCSTDIGLVYGSLIWFNSTKYNRITSLSFPKNITKRLVWKNWGLHKQHGGVVIKTPAGDIVIETGTLYNQGVVKDGFVRSGPNNNTAYSFSYPLAKYATFFGENTSGYFEHVKTSFLDTDGSMSWVCIYLFHHVYGGFLCGNITGTDSIYAHGMLVNKATGESQWLPQWAFSIKNPSCLVKSTVANISFPNCFHVKTPFIEFETTPNIIGDFGSTSPDNKIKSWIGTTDALADSGAFMTITEIVLTS